MKSRESAKSRTPRTAPWPIRRPPFPGATGRTGAKPACQDGCRSAGPSACGGQAAAARRLARAPCPCPCPGARCPLLLSPQPQRLGAVPAARPAPPGRAQSLSAVRAAEAPDGGSARRRAARAAGSSGCERPRRRWGGEGCSGTGRQWRQLRCKRVIPRGQPEASGMREVGCGGCGLPGWAGGGAGDELISPA